MRLLAIYLNDQLALVVAGRELARRAERENVGTDLGTFLQRLALEVTEDVDTLERIMKRLDLPISSIKPPLAVVAERVARFKPNGRVRGYSPLSRFLELESLALGLEGKKVLWSNLRDLAGVSGRLDDVDLEALVERARRQRDELERHRVEAGRVALAA